MARFRLRLVFNPGRIGSPMDKLGEFTSQTERFLRALSIDLGIAAKKGEWLAQNFTDDSVAFDCEFASSVPEEVARRGRDALEIISGDHPLDACNKGLVTHTTVAEFGRVGKVLDPDEKFLVGLYDDGAAQPSKWLDVDYRKTAKIRQLLDCPLVSYGSVQGTLHAWHAGARPGFIQVRELSNGSLVRCVYRGDLYSRVHQATRIPNTVIHVYGDIRWDRTTNAILEVDIKGLDLAEPLSEDEFARLFGSMPHFTGTMSTADYIDWLRGDAD
jgi:hypothetical protein